MGTYVLREDEVLHWPEMSQLPDGRWIRHWEVVFLQHFVGALDLAKVGRLVTEHDFEVKASQKDERTLTLTVTNVEFAMADHFYFATYRMFERLDAFVGAIDSIAGRPARPWERWKSR
jgi:hypothetical protein